MTPGIRSPWYPFVFANYLTRKSPALSRNIPVPFEQWILWLAHVELPPEQPQDEALAVVQSAIQ
jgi:hypothetical protein